MRLRQPDGSVVRVPPPASAKRALANAKDPFKAKVPDEFKSTEFGRGKRWKVCWFETRGNGEKKPKGASFSKHEDAEKKLIAIADEQLSGKYINTEDANRLFADAAREWRASQHDLARGTASQYDGNLRAYVLPRWGNVPLSKIDESSINEWVIQLREGRAPHEFKPHAHKDPAQLRPSSLSLIVNAVFKSILLYSVKRGWLTKSPMENIHVSRKDPERESRRKVFLDYGEIEALADAAENLPSAGKYRRTRKDTVSAAMIRFMAYVGTRPGETFALRVGDIDLATRRVTVNKTVGKDGIEGPTKGKKERKVAIPQSVVEQLRPLMKGRDIDDYLFRTKGGKRLNQDNWRWRVFYRAAEAAGLGDLDGLRPHSLRHSFASLSIKAGCDVVTLAAALGHTDIKVTLNDYAGLWPDQLDTVADALEKGRESAVSTPHYTREDQAQ